MLIATWNVNSIKARLDFVLRWLQERQPDAVCLQELKVPKERFPFEALKAAGYHAYVHAQPTWNGVAILSKKPATIVQEGLPGAEEAGARFLTVSLDGMHLSSVYVPNGKTLEHADFKVKLAFMRALDAQLRKQTAPSGLTLVGGDYNIVHRDIDSHDGPAQAGDIFHTDEERETLKGLLDGDLHDLYRELEPEGDTFSWWDYRGGSFPRNRGLRIDLLLASQSLKERAERVWVDRDYRKKQDGMTPSDHAPVIAQFKA